MTIFPTESHYELMEEIQRVALLEFGPQNQFESSKKQCVFRTLRFSVGKKKERMMSAKVKLKI